MSCPNDCSNHGTCEYLDEINGGLTSWDAHKIQMCACDPGYTGYDCSERICPQGDDPITTSGISVVYNFQTDATPAGDVTLKYNDWRGNTFETNALDLATITANVIQEALLALPNQAVTSVTVTGSDPSDGAGFDITFNSPTSGASDGLTVQSVVCAVHGCQPKVTTASTNTLALTVGSTQTIEFATCSNRGSCDTTTGLCLCESGYFGEACEGQTIIM
jgi:hypothetical protein